MVRHRPDIDGSKREIKQQAGNRSLDEQVKRLANCVSWNRVRGLAGRRFVYGKSSRRLRRKPRPAN
jgi:hypothetical protein